MPNKDPFLRSIPHQTPGDWMDEQPWLPNLLEDLMDVEESLQILGITVSSILEAKHEHPGISLDVDKTLQELLTNISSMMSEVQDVFTYMNVDPDFTGVDV